MTGSPRLRRKDRKMQHIKHLLEQEIETLATPTNTVIPANTRAAIEFDFGFDTFGENKLCEAGGIQKVTRIQEVAER